MTRRAAAEASGPFALATMLPAHVEVMLAAGELEEARRAADELAGIAATGKRALLEALAARTQGEVELARRRSEGRAQPPFDAARASGRS